MGFPSKISGNDLAKLLGVTPRRVAQLVDEGVLARTGRGTFDAAQAIQAYTRFRVRAAGEEAGRYHGLSKERAGLVRAQRELAQIALDRAKREVAPIDALAHMVAAKVGIIKNRFLQLASRTASALDPRDPGRAHAIVYAATVKILSELNSLDTVEAARGAILALAGADEPEAGNGQAAH
jgi:phage terminase Nu1 subunit (DNA packaging protein)